MRCGFQQYCDAYATVQLVGTGKPAFHKTRSLVFQQTRSRVGHMKYRIILLVFSYFIQNHKMILIPMNNAGQWNFFTKLNGCNFYANGPEAYFLRCIADSQ